MWLVSLHMNSNLDWAAKLKPNKPLALTLAKREVSVLVYDAVQLEGINFRLPEIQTLLDGITVGGHKLSDQLVATNQLEAWRLLFNMVERGEFSVSKEVACKIHSEARKKEALERGVFRAGMVTIAGTEYLPPPQDALDALYQKLSEEVVVMPDVYDRAIHVFLSMARNQFFFDVNKRMGRFMMNGVLLDAGYPVINLPAKRQLEFNELMIDFYNTGYEAPMNLFMRSCVDPRLEKIMV